jgi:peptidyl-prolyl cis-trans isomerase A (cyclophilin A)
VRRLGTPFAIVALTAGGGALIAGQQSASLSGVVRDASGGLLPGVAVAIASPGHREPLVAVTDAKGHYSFPRILPGTYTATAELAAFAKFANENLEVAGGGAVELNLALASRSTEISVLEGLPPPAVVAIPVRLDTAFGAIDLAIDTVNAPVTARNFLKYVDGGFYDGGRFYRTTRPDTYHPVLPNRPPMTIIQGGMRQGAQPGFGPIPLERTSFTGLKHTVGVISMARNGPDSATSEFFILLDDQPSLDSGGKRFDDGQGAAAFGRVTSGLDVVRKINAEPVSDRQPTPDNPLTRTQNLTPPVPITGACRFPKSTVSRDGNVITGAAHASAGCSSDSNR